MIISSRLKSVLRKSLRVLESAPSSIASEKYLNNFQHHRRDDIDVFKQKNVLPPEPFPLETVEILRRSIEQAETIKMKAKLELGEDVDFVSPMSNYNLLERQLEMEKEQQVKSIESYLLSIEGLIKMGKGANLKYIEKTMLAWYEPLYKSLCEEISNITSLMPGVDRRVK